MSIDREAWLQVCAYYIWQSEGSPEGADRAHWAAAERLFAEVAPAPEAVPAPAPEAAVSTAKRTRSVKAAVAEAVTKAAKPAVRRKKPAAQSAAPAL